MRILNKSLFVAKKDYECEACVWIIERGIDLELTFSEERSIVKARKNDFQIKKGETYFGRVCVNDRKLSIFRAIPAIHEICIAYNIYPEEWE